MILNIQLIELHRLLSKKETKLLKGHVRTVTNSRKELNEFMEKMEAKYLDQILKVT